MEITVTIDNFETEVLQADKPVFVDFWAAWCGPCKMLGPIVAQIAEEHTEVKVCKIDIDAQEALAKKYSIMSIPTVILFKNGAPVNTSVGLVSKEKLLAMLG